MYFGQKVATLGVAGFAIDLAGGGFLFSATRKGGPEFDPVFIFGDLADGVVSCVFVKAWMVLAEFNWMT